VLHDVGLRLMGEVCPVFHNVSSSTPETDLNAMH
jgi:hypothetical protein